MSYQVAKDTVDWLIRNAEEVNETASLGFFGGEPLLEWDTIIVPLTKYIREDKQSNMSLGITSNCILLDEEKLKFMDKYNISLLVSMDGAKATQDFNRPLRNGESSFDVLDKVMPLIIKYQPNATFRSTIVPDTCEHFCENLEYAREKGFNHVFAIINEFEDWPQDKREILEKQLRQYSNYLIESCLEEKPFLRQRTLEQAINKIVSNNILAVQESERTPYKEINHACGLGIGYGSVNYKGNIYSCQEVSSRQESNIFYIGNIYTGVVENRISQLKEKISKKTHVENNKNKKLCLTCPIISSCNASACLVNNYLDNKDFFLQSDNICWWNNLMVREAQYICQTLGNVKNNFFKEYFSWVITSFGGVLS